MKKYFSISALALFSVLCLSVTLSSCDKDDKDKEGNNSIIGTWAYYGYGYTETGDFDSAITKEDENTTLTFLSDGTGTVSFEDEDTGEVVRRNYRWSINGGTLTFIHEGYEDNPKSATFKVENNKFYMLDHEGDIDVYERV